jgi:hypothetical protein
MPNPTAFVPSRDGFAFTNAWPSEPAVVLPTPFGKIRIGDAAAGLCGGMVFAALDYWHTGIVPPAARPAPGELAPSTHRRAILGRTDVQRRVPA